MNWQVWVAAAIVFAAAVWLVRRSWKIVRAALGSDGEAVGCYGCSKRGSTGDRREPAAAKETSLVQLGGPPRRGGEDGSGRSS